jgi:hypothetical protein
MCAVVCKDMTSFVMMSDFFSSSTAKKTAAQNQTEKKSSVDL